MAPRKAAGEENASISHKTAQASVSPAKVQSTISSKTATGKLKSILKNRDAQKTGERAVSQTSSPSSRRHHDVSPGKPIANGGIKAFFNNAAQNPRKLDDATERSSRASTPLNNAEGIDSDDDGLALSKGSSTALALRKRKTLHQNGNLSNGHAEMALPASQKFRRTDSGRTPVMALHNNDTRPWTVQFAPDNLDDLAVHKRKVADVRGWLTGALAARHNRCLLLKGPAGSAKTTTLKLLAQDLDVEVLEWSNPAGADQVESAQNSGSHFEDFISRSGRSSGLTFQLDDDTVIAGTNTVRFANPHKRQILLVEEFPSTFSKTSPALQSFRSAIAQHLASRNAVIPIVLVVSETLLSSNTAAADSFTTHRLLGPELSSHPFLDTIEFNAIAPTILLKAIENVIVREARKSGRRTTPNPAVLKRLTEFGDIRSAISTLEFLCLRGDDEGIWSAKIAFSKPKKKLPAASLTKVEQEAMSWLASRESTLGIFHGVGKVLYNKRSEENNAKPESSWTSQHHRPLKPENNVNDLIGDLGTDTSTFIAALHENYLLSCNASNRERTLDTVFSCIEDLSDSDLLSMDRISFGNKAYSGTTSAAMAQDELAFQVVVRGLLFNLPANVKRSGGGAGARVDAHRMYFPTSLKLWRRREEIDAAIDALKVKLRTYLKTSRTNTDTAYSLANTNAMSWSKSAEDDTAPATSKMSFTNTASKELLVTSLPYLVSPLQKWSADSILLDLMKTVTGMKGTSTDDSNEEVAEDNATDEQTGRIIDPLNKRNKKQSLAFDNNATAQIESLVLEDDDIEDD